MARHGGLLPFPRERTPFPTKQLAVLAICRICEPIAFMSIFPYAYEMIGTFGIARTPAEIAVYMGMVTSAFAFAECASSVFWGRLSDRIGRKSVLLGGLFGTGLSMLLFGYATNLPMALFARAMGGLLNGNMGVLQTTVAEIVTVEEHQPRAFAIMPFVWCLGTIIGSSLGGVLADPAKSWPALDDTIFHTYKYLLPNLVCTAVVICGLVVGILFLEETHEDLKYNRDRGREVGQWILRRFQTREEYMPLTDKDESLDEFRSMLLDHGSATYRSTDSSPTLCSSRTSIEAPPPFSLEKECYELPKVRDAFTKQIWLNIVGIGILAFHTISLETLLPILMQHPKADPKIPVQLPFKFTGGFHYPTQKTGAILAIQGVVQMFAQLVLFPRVSQRLGSLRTFWLTIAAYPFLYFLAPYLVLLPERLRVPGLIVLLVWKVTAQAFSYPSLSIMLAAKAPSKKVLGTLYGASASSASVMRGFGPTISGAVATLGDNYGVSGLAWWTCAIIAMMAWIPASFMTAEKKRPGHFGTEQDEEVGLEEALADNISDTDSVTTLAPYETIDLMLPK